MNRQALAEMWQLTRVAEGSRPGSWAATQAYSRALPAWSTREEQALAGRMVSLRTTADDLAAPRPWRPAENPPTGAECDSCGRSTATHEVGIVDDHGQHAVVLTECPLCAWRERAAFCRVQIRRMS